MQYLSLIYNILSVEKELNYNNASYFGGFNHFIINALNKLHIKADEEIGLLKLYNTLEIKEKEVLIRKLGKVLEVFSNRGNISNTSFTSSTLNLPAELSTLDKIKGIGLKRYAQLKKLGVSSVDDLLNYYPKRYEDRRNLKKIALLEDTMVETFYGKVMDTDLHSSSKRGLVLFKAAVQDETGLIEAVWFNQAFLKDIIRPQQTILITGKIKKALSGFQVNVTDYEIINELSKDISNNGIVPFYALREGLSQKFIRNTIKMLWKNFGFSIEENLPQEILRKYSFLSKKEAVYNIHFPKDYEILFKAQQRLIYEELFYFALNLFDKQRAVRDAGLAHKSNLNIIDNFTASLPFVLTEEQQKVIAEIIVDMESNQQMFRLLQGDVGSGKTIVGLIALLKTIEAGYQGVLMAPTEILAEQHYLSIMKLLENLHIEVCLLTGSVNKQERMNTIARIANGEFKIIIGTHVLLNSELSFKNLGLIVIDEQHRFGVLQRSNLIDKGQNSDVLVMTATPIPRTLALALYGNINVSVINGLPPGRQKVVTKYVPENKRSELYSFMEKEILQGRQAYIICPLVEESEIIDAENVMKMFTSLQEEIFREYSIGYLHGKLSYLEKEKIMKNFRDNKINILVSTTVVEVGINIENATIMIIEDVERFGLAQLHQLRGRIGRGKHKSYCFLLGNPKSKESQARVKILENNIDGFRIAEEDLKLRGPGEFFGIRQHGLPNFKIANLFKDLEVLENIKNDLEQLNLSAEDKIILSKQQPLNI